MLLGDKCKVWIAVFSEPPDSARSIICIYFEKPFGVDVDCHVDFLMSDMAEQDEDKQDDVFGDCSG